MEDVNKNLANFFDIEHTEKKEITKDTKPGLTAFASQDYEFTRKNLKTLIETGAEGLQGILKVANESDSPRAYEVLATMMKTIADINVNLMDVSTKYAETNKVTIKNNTNNSIFVGTTKDLQTLLKSQTDVVEGEINEPTPKGLPGQS